VLMNYVESKYSSNIYILLFHNEIKILTLEFFIGREQHCPHLFIASYTCVRHKQEHPQFGLTITRKNRNKHRSSIDRVIGLGPPYVTLY
jgi:hypothetical protein